MAVTWSLGPQPQRRRTLDLEAFLFRSETRRRKCATADRLRLKSDSHIPASSNVMNDRIEQLAKVDLFAGLKPQAIELIAKVATEESHALGTKIFQHGDAGDKLYLILEGKVRISREVPGMGEEALAVLGPGQLFGEMALLDESPRSADANVHETCRLLAVPRDAFDDLLFLNKDLAYEVLWSIVKMLLRRLRETNDKLTFLSTTNKF